MARIDIYKSGSWPEFLEQKEEWLGADPPVVTVPEPADKGQLIRALPELRPGDLFTIPELIDRYLKNRGGKGLISIHTAASILGSIVGDSSASYLRIEEYKQGYVKALTDFIHDYRGTATMDLRTALENLREGRLSPKEKDLIAIHAEYARRLPDYGFDLQSGLAAFVQDTDAENIGRHLGVKDGVRLVFFGFDHLDPLEEEFIRTVCKHAAGVALLCCEDATAPEPAVRVHMDLRALLLRIKDAAVEHRLPSRQQDGFFDDLSRTLFQAKQQPPALEAQGKLFLTKENTRYVEIVSIARRIKHLVAEGVPYHAIGIAAPAYDLYSAIVQEVFPEYEIPFHLEDGVPLLRFPLAALVLNLVNQGLHPNPYPIRDKIFSSPYTSFNAAIERRDLVDYQKSTGVEMLPAEKIDPFLASGGEYRLDYDFLRHIRDTAYRAVRPARDMHHLEMLRKYLEGLAWKNEAEKQDWLCRCLIQGYLLAQAEKGLPLGPARMSGAEFRAGLLGLWRRFHLEDNIRFAGEQGRLAAAPDVQARDLAVLRQIGQLLEEIESFAAPMGEAAADKFSLLELGRIFSRLMSEARLPTAAAGVAVQPVGGGRYARWDHCFLCGLVDGEFPRAEEFNFLRPRKEGLGLGRVYTSVDYDRHRFYTLVRSTAKALYLSFPLSHNGRRLPPSPFVKEVETRLPGKTAGLDGRREEQDRAYSRREKLLGVGKNVDRDYGAALPLLREIGERDEAFYQKIAAIMRFDGLVANSISLSEYDGVFGAEAPLELLAEEIGRIAFTPEVFERYAACPLRFFLDDLMGLKTGEDYHLDTTENGVLVRSILKEYTAEACAAGETPAGAAQSLAAAVARHFAQKFQGAEDAFQARLQNQMAAGLEQPEARRPGLFAAFLAHEKSAPDLLRPYRGNLSGAVRLGPALSIQVEIERVDLTLAGDWALLFSYTTAGTGDPGKIARGLRFDLPLAVVLWSRRAAAEGARIPAAGAGMYMVKAPKAIRRGGYFVRESLVASRQANVSAARPIFSGQREGLLPDDYFAEALAKIEAHLLRLHRLMHMGVFHPPLCAESDQSCANCSFGRICRQDQLRLDRLRVNLRDDETVNLVRDIL